MKNTIAILVAFAAVIGAAVHAQNTNTSTTNQIVLLSYHWERATNEVEGPMERITQPGDTPNQTTFRNPALEPHAWNHRVHREVVSNLVAYVSYNDKTNVLMLDSILVHATNYSWRFQRSTN